MAKNESFIALAVAVVVGMLVLLSFGRWLGRVRFSVSNAFWCSLIGHVASFIAFFALGFLFSNYFLAAFLIGIALVWVFQTILFQVFVRTQNEILVGWRAGVLSFIVILADFLIVSPAVEIVQRITAK